MYYAAYSIPIPRGWWMSNLKKNAKIPEQLGKCNAMY